MKLKNEAERTEAENIYCTTLSSKNDVLIVDIHGCQTYTFNFKKGTSRNFNN